MSNLQKIIVILGPTASGKTDLAVKLAKKFNGEIISTDSRQVYKEMSVGTAKPSKTDIKKIPHHLVDIIWPNQNFNVAIFKKLAVKVIKDILKRGKIPFLVGGTGLYIKAIVDNIHFPKVPPNKGLREKLERKTEKELFKIYKKLDPEGAKFIEIKNKRRLVRAIEVSKATKKPFWQQRKKGKPLFDILEIGLKLPKKELKRRIEKRTEQMFKLGLDKEVKSLVKKYGWIPPLRTICYQEWHNHFENKIREKPTVHTQEVKEKIKLHTLQFTRRQMTWFKRDERIKWIKNYQEAEKLIKQFLHPV